MEFITNSPAETEAVGAGLKQKSKAKRKKKIATAICEYQADCDGEWGEISLRKRTALQTRR